MTKITEVNPEPSFLERYMVSIVIIALSIIFRLVIIMVFFQIAEIINGYELSAFWPVVITAIAVPYLNEWLKKLIAKHIINKLI